MKEGKLPQQKKLLTPRLLVDLALGATCIGLLVTMLGQLDALKAMEADMDKLRRQIEVRKSDARTDQAQPARLTEQKP